MRQSLGHGVHHTVYSASYTSYGLRYAGHLPFVSLNSYSSTQLSFRGMPAYMAWTSIQEGFR
ncbi:hypothetical protein BDZ89DRAFT_1057336, partial [Hymenopellis radicata]